MKFLGSRLYNDQLLIDPYNTNRCHLFVNQNHLGHINWGEYQESINPYNISSMQYIKKLVEQMNQVYSKCSSHIMNDLFPTWPDDPIEEWAIENNDYFELEFDSFYDSQSISFIIYIRCFGHHSMDPYEYMDSYYQSLTMRKLSSNI